MPVRMLNVAAWEALECEISGRLAVNARIHDPVGFHVTHRKECASPLCRLVRTDPSRREAVCTTAHREFSLAAGLSRGPVTGCCPLGLFNLFLPVNNGLDLAAVVAVCGARLPDHDLDLPRIASILGVSLDEASRFAGQVPVVQEIQLSELAAWLPGRIEDMISLEIAN